MHRRLTLMVMSEVNRRAALTTLLTTASGAACSRPEATPEEQHNARAKAEAARPDPVPAVNPIISVEPLTGPPWKTQDPFLFCVHHDDRYPKGNEQLGPAVSLRGRHIGSDFSGKDGWRMYHGDVVPGFPQHPHRGFETVTVVRRGLLDHSDSLGATARYGEGDVQWLTAGKGIIHAEMFPLLKRDQENPLELFQIWLNLPKANKMVDPHFTMIWGEDVPKRQIKDQAGRITWLTLHAGSYGRISPPSAPPDSWASQADADVAIWTIRLAPGATFTLPAAKVGTGRTLYFFEGSELDVAERSIPAKHQVALYGAHAVTLKNPSDHEIELLLLQGRPIGEPVAQHGPFVMNTKDEIRQAFFDYQRTQFGGWPWHRDDPVHAATEGRFAKHADGRIERPA